VRLAQLLVEAQDVALGVDESGALLVLCDPHVVHGLEAGQVIVLEAHAALLQIPDFAFQVAHFEAEGGVFRLRAFRMVVIWLFLSMVTSSRVEARAGGIGGRFGNLGVQGSGKRTAAGSGDEPAGKG
jgi:hypothetical protein